MSTLSPEDFGEGLSTKGPRHYTDLEIQPWDAMEAWMTPEMFKGYLLGNTIKYISRCLHKGQEISDLNKAKHYIEKLLEQNLK